MHEPVSVPGTDTQRDCKQRPRVIAVDDQRDALKLLEVQLAAGGMECHAFLDGPSALEYLEKGLADVMILDVMMPRMDGYEVCRRMKSNERTRDIPVIFLTAKSDVADRVIGLEAGGHDFLSKPVQQPELLARTQAALRVKQLQDQLKQQIRLQHEIQQLHRGMLSEHWQKTLGQLAVSLAHEINNPLAAALGTTQLMQLQHGLDPETRKGLQTIDGSLRRASQKLRSLLLIAHPGRHRRNVVLAELIEDLLTLVNYRIVLGKVTVNTEIDRSCEWNGVSSDLGRALLYVLDNALEAVVGRFDPTIQITVSKGARDQNIIITDNGPGISPAIGHRIFEPFFTTKGPPHNGAGLFLAGEIAKTLNCTIDFESPPGGASTRFIVHLPLNGSRS